MRAIMNQISVLWNCLMCHQNRHYLPLKWQYTVRSETGHTMSFMIVCIDLIEIPSANSLFRLYIISLCKKECLRLFISSEALAWQIKIFCTFGLVFYKWQENCTIRMQRIHSNRVLTNSKRIEETQTLRVLGIFRSFSFSRTAEDASKQEEFSQMSRNKTCGK